MAGGLTSTGFTRSNLQELILEWEKDLQDIYGNPRFSVEDNENFGALVKVAANRESLAWQAMEQIYNSWTLNGAEDIFLDEIFALNGIFREGATAGSGFATVETDSTAIDSTAVVAGTLFSGENGIQYASTEDTLVSQRVTAFKIEGSEVSLDSYSLSVTNRVTGATFSGTFTLSSSSDVAILTFLQEIESFLQQVNTSETRLNLDEENLILYYGFNSAYELRGLSESINLLSTPSLGNRYSLVEGTATTTGFNQLRAGEITSMSILPDGYVSVTNLSQFSAGTDVETDAAFIERARIESDSPRSSSRPAIISGLLSNVSGVEKVRFVKSVDAGVVTIRPVIIGGEAQEIGEELYRTQPIDNVYSGDISVEVETEDEEIETIRFSRGGNQGLSVRVTYSTTLGTSLSDTEIATSNENLTDFSEQWQLGDTIFNAQLMASVFQSSSYGRFKTLVVETKKKEDPDSSYTTSDYLAGDDELPTLLDSDITYVQVIN